MIKNLFIGIILCLVTTLSVAENSPIRTTPLPGTVALTFDDGPNPAYTLQILAILKKYNIKATFFVLGMNAIRYPEVIALASAEGHVIASHSLTNPLLTKLNDQQLAKEIKMPSTIIHTIIGKYPACFRYPFGETNEHVQAVIRQNEMQPIPMGWNSFDDKRPGVDAIVNQVLKGASSGQVILLHDGIDQRQQTVDALPKIIEGIKKKKLGFSTICVN